MDEMPKIEVPEMGHLGLISAVVKKFKILERINLLLPKESNNQKINHSQAILAMIYQGLGFCDGRLYFAKGIEMDLLANFLDIIQKQKY